MHFVDLGPPAFAATPTATHQLAFSHRNPLRFNVTADVSALLADTTGHDVSWLLRNTAELNGVWVDPALEREREAAQVDPRNAGSNRPPS